MLNERAPLKISEVLRRLRKVNKLTQDELARKLGVSASYLSLLERDKRPATMRVLHSASNWLGIAAGLFLLQAMELDALSPPQQKLVREVRRELKKAILTGDYRLLKLISRGRFKLPSAGR